MKDKELHIRMLELAEEKGISKTGLCKDLGMQYGNFNNYCLGEFKRIDVNLIIKLCDYFQCEISDLLEIRDKEHQTYQPVRRKYDD